MRARKADLTDVKRIAEIHKSAFGKELFSIHLPDELLEEYFAALITANKYCYVAESDEGSELYGYVIGGYKTQQAVDEFMKKNIGSVIKIMMANPKFIFKSILRLIKKIFKAKLYSKAALRLYLIGVDKSSNKKGTGSLLISKFEEELLKDEIKLYGLFVHNFNKNAISFYEKRGFEHEFNKDDMKAYIKRIKE